MIALGLWLLGGLAAVVLAAVAGRLDRRTALLTVAGFAAAAAVAAAGWAVDPVWTGALLAGAAVAALLERLAVPLAALLSGVAAGSWLLIAATLALPVVVVA